MQKTKRSFRTAARELFGKTADAVRRHKYLAAWSVGVAAAFTVLSPWAAVPLAISGGLMMGGIVDREFYSWKSGSIKNVSRSCLGFCGNLFICSAFIAGPLAVSAFVWEASAPFSSMSKASLTEDLKKKDAWALGATFPTEKAGKIYEAKISDIRHIAVTSEATGQTAEAIEAEATVQFMGKSFWTGKPEKRTVSVTVRRPTPPSSPMDYSGLK